MSLQKLANNLSKINIPLFINEELKSQDIQNEIVRLIQVRLYFEGTDSNNRKLRTDRSKQQGLHPYYAFYTAGVKTRLIPRRARRTYDNRDANVTLNDYGDFYKSFKVSVKDNLAEIKANFIKKQGHIYKNFNTSYSSAKEFEDAILNLTDRDIEELTKILYPRLMKRVTDLINV